MRRPIARVVVRYYTFADKVAITFATQNLEQLPLYTLFTLFNYCCSRTDAVHC